MTNPDLLDHVIDADGERRVYRNGRVVATARKNAIDARLFKQFGADGPYGKFAPSAAEAATTRNEQ